MAYIVEQRAELTSHTGDQGKMLDHKAPAENDPIKANR
jgi:hypothetical protein